MLDLARRTLVPQHFPDQVLSNLFIVLQRYADQTGAVATRAGVADLLANQLDAGRIALYLETFDALVEMVVPDGEIAWSMAQLRELAADRATAAALSEASEILVRSRGSGGLSLPARHLEARSHVLNRFVEIEREFSVADAPEGDVRDEASDILAEYAERKRLRVAGSARAPRFGIPALDARIGGLSKGELCFVAAYSGDGKTVACCQMAWHAAVQQGLNVFFATTETIRSQVRRKLISRHSRLPMFGLPAGLDSNALKGASLVDAAERVFDAVVRDLTSNPAYGKLHVAQVPHGATLGMLEARVRQVERQRPVDLVVLDYLALLGMERRRSSMREEISDLCKEAKRFAVTYNGGKGVPVVSPWQTNRTSHAAGQESKSYTSAALAESAEATNSADVIISLIRTAEPAPLGITKLRGQVLKNRDGPTVDSLALQAEYATTCIRDDAAAAVGESFTR
jgi:replicative DNA helicase